MQLNGQPLGERSSRVVQSGEVSVNLVMRLSSVGDSGAGAGPLHEGVDELEPASRGFEIEQGQGHTQIDAGTDEEAQFSEGRFDSERVDS